MIQDPKVIVKAEREVAYDSPDHLAPWGTRADSSKNLRFNQKLYFLYPRRESFLSVLDLGCSGGGFVKSCLDDGCLAVGLEGSDFSKKRRRAEWATIPDFLFTCDITRDFEVLIDDGKNTDRVHFDIVTAWEVVEHIKTEDLRKLAENVKKHLKPSGLWIMSVSPNEEIVNGVVLHQTVQPKEWWIETFKNFGFTHLPEYDRYFNTQYVRGPKYGGPESFHLILSLNPEEAPTIPPQSIRSRLYDQWLGSKYQKLLRRFVIGES
jgi:SAM-dependent methyltransferase